MNETSARSYTLRKENGEWLGQIVLTTDGMFSSVTDYGNFGYAWRTYGTNFREFMSSISTDYFASKLVEGMAYVVYSKKVTTACKVYAENILPPLQKLLKFELENDIGWFD